MLPDSMKERPDASASDGEKIGAVIWRLVRPREWARLNSYWNMAD